jgi:glutathione S-transferase
MAPIKLYIDAMSQPSRAVHMLLLEGSKSGKLSFEVVPTQISRGATRSPEFLKVNPNGHVPAIDDNGLVLYESHTIMRYIVNKYGSSSAASALADHWYPANPSERALIDMYLDWHHGYLRRGSSMLVFSTQFARALGQMDEEQIARVSKEGASLLRRSLKRMEESYLSDDESSHGFLMGQSLPSIADLSAANELYMTVQLVGYSLTPYPRVTRWLERVQRATTPNSWPIANATLDKIVRGRAAKKAAAAAVTAAAAPLPSQL